MAIRKLKENIDTWEKDISEILNLVDRLELPTDEGMESVVVDKLLKIRYAINKTIKEYHNITSESKKLKESRLREFNKSDWMTYQGASNFEDGSSPLIAELLSGNITIIVSGGDNNNGKAFIEVDFLDELTDEPYAYGNEFKSKERAINAANQMVRELDSWEGLSEDDIDDFAYSYNLEML